MRITVTVNDVPRTDDVEPRTLLVDHLRTRLGLTGTHVGCDTTSCGACTVLFDGRPVKSCTIFAVQADGHAIRTVEGLKGADGLHPVQAAFKEHHGLQCGFCTSGMMLVGAALLEEDPDPDEDDVRWAISGNLCRCTGYVNIVKAIRAAGATLRGEAVDDPAAGDELTEGEGAVPSSTPVPVAGD
jgi:carbon-monoxide dehydrogenase small subunit